MKQSILSFIFSYIITRLIFNFVNFNYNFFVEGMNFTKLMIDFISWALIYYLIYKFLDLWLKK
ncbi:hypothetical protein BX659_111111 [Orenia metallireducens]|uniref:Uncharacterized protein n=1 Tax=Orenia metallireducens TaxID=1413210 RepID=A0A285HBN5_9FIRM|nr:hypothetical protein BX659_111111 [Orenia metallireducens]SNY33064.1 hypothetical protein SAMN06265827_116111 [Orenia metallireducens]